MKIALVLHHFDPARGGAEQWTYRFAQFAAAAGHEIHVVARTFAVIGRELTFQPHVVDAPRGRLAFAASAEAILRRLAVDVIHDMGGGWYFDVWQPHEGSRRGQMERRLLAERPWMRSVKQSAMRWLPRYREFDQMSRRQLACGRGGRALAVSQLVADDLMRCNGWPRERIATIHNGVDLDRFSPSLRGVHRAEMRARLGIHANEALALFVAHNFALKGLRQLLAAVGRLAAAGQPIRLAVVGGRCTRSWRRLAVRLGAGAVAEFVGSAPDTAPYYAAADLFALPTWYDSCSLGVLEALASGLPVVTTGHNGAAELLTEGKDGHVVADPGDVDTLATRLLRLMDPETRLAMGTAARRTAERHSWSRNCKAVLDLYREIAGAERRRAA